MSKVTELRYKYCKRSAHRVRELFPLLHTIYRRIFSQQFSDPDNPDVFSKQCHQLLGLAQIMVGLHATASRTKGECTRFDKMTNVAVLF